MQIVGIYSFPKSGNTWLRAVIASRLKSKLAGVPDMHRHKFATAEKLRGFRFYKHHGAQPLAHLDGLPVAAHHILHIRRNPLDVFVSYLNFVSDNVTGAAPVRFPSVEAMVEGAEKRTRRNGRFVWRKREKTYLDFLDAEQIALFLEQRSAEIVGLGYDPDWFLQAPEMPTAPAVEPETGR